MSRAEPHRFKKAIKDKRPAVGLYSTLCSVAAIEILGYCGIDYVVVDTEHNTYGTTIDLPAIERMIAAASRTGMSLLVRVPRNDFATAVKVLDMGANGVVFPRVNTKQDALAAVAATKFRPIGERGYSRARKAILERTDGLTFTSDTNDDVILMLMIEETEAVNNIDEILSVKGIDAIDTGPGDLSYGLGIPSQYQSTKLREALEKVYDACAKNKMPFSICLPMFGEEVIRKYINKGFCVVVDLHTDEEYFVSTLREQMTSVKSRFFEKTR